MVQRGQRTSPFSLFSFQDIITCVSGIFILITLMLVLQLVQRKQAKPQVDASEIAAQLRAAIAAAQTEVNRLASMLESESSRIEVLAGISVETVRRELFDTSEVIKLMEAELADLTAQELKVKKEEASAQADLFDRLQEEPLRREMEGKSHDLEDQLKSVKNSDQLIYNSTTPQGKTIWLAQLDTGVIFVAPSGIKQKPEEFRDRFGSNATSAFGTWLSKRSPSQDYFFLLVRPGGTDELESVRELLADRGFSVGFDVLGDDQQAVDPIHGAALP